MHELSIATSIVDIAESEAEKNNVKVFSLIELDIGDMSGVVIEALEFAMEEACKNSVLADAKLKINKIPARAKCTKCNNIFEVQEIYTPCPKCNNLYTDIISGKEMQVKKLIT